MTIHIDSSILLKIKSLYPSLKRAEKKVADYILNDPESFIYGNLASAAKGADVSEATFVRFCKQLGYSGYRDMHIAVAATQKTDSQEGIFDLDVEESTSIADIPEWVILRTMCALNNMRKSLNSDAYLKAVDKLDKAKRVCVFGAGNSAFVGKDIANKFLRLGKDVQASSDPHMQVTYAMTLGEGDVAIAISHSGRTQQSKEALRLAKEQGAATICITNFEASEVAVMSDILLLTASHEKKLQSETMVSRLSQLAIVDMLYLGVLQKNYNRYAPMIEKQNAAIVSQFF